MRCARNGQQPTTRAAIGIEDKDDLPGLSRLLLLHGIPADAHRIWHAHGVLAVYGQLARLRLVTDDDGAPFLHAQ